MKKRILIAVIALMLVFNTLVYSPALFADNKAWVYRDYITDAVEATYEWSGTWGIPGTEGTNNPGTNAFNGITGDKWGSYDICVSGEEWVAAHFKETVRISSWTIYQEQSGSYTNIIKYCAQVKKTASSGWETIYTSGVLNEFWLKDTVELETFAECVSWRFLVYKNWAKPGKHGSGPDTYAVELGEIELGGYQLTDENGTGGSGIVVDGELLKSAEAINIDTEDYDFTGEDGAEFWETKMSEFFDVTEVAETFVIEDDTGAYLDINTFFDLHTFYDDEINGPYAFSVTMKYIEGNENLAVFARTLPANAFSKSTGSGEISSWPLFEYDYYRDFGGTGNAFIGAAGVLVTPVLYKNKLSFQITVKQYAPDSLNITDDFYIFGHESLPKELSESLSADDFFTVRYVDDGAKRTYIFINDILMCCMEYSGDPVVYDETEGTNYEYYPTASILNAAGETVHTVNNTRMAANSWICGIGVRNCHTQISNLAYGRGIASDTTASPEQTGKSTAAPTPSATVKKEEPAEENSNILRNVLLIVGIAAVIVAAAYIIILVSRKRKKG